MEKSGERIVFAGGGTGGHLFPALAVAYEIGLRHPGAQISFVGARRGIESRLVPEAGYPLRTLPLAGIKGTRPWRRFTAASAAAMAILRCLVWMVRARPRLVIGVGGYASGPAVLAAHWLGVKTMVMEQNHFPGATNRYLARRVDAVCLPSEAARDRLGGLGIVTGNPVREEFTRIGDPPGSDGLTVLVFGGSRGARSINRAVTDALPVLARLSPPPRIIHQTGEEEQEAVSEAYRDYPSGRWEVLAFFHDMPARMAVADLVVSRAGATTLAELAAAGRPAILVPYPFAADDHQRHNAEAVAREGAAVVVPDRELGGEGLAGLIGSLASDPGRLRRMGAAARRLSRPDAARRIADVADTLLAGGGARVP